MSLRSDGTEQFWAICCLGRKLQNGRIELKIRPELKEAFDETGALKGIEVTKEGKVFLSYARQVLEQADLITKKNMNLLRYAKKYIESLKKYC